MHSILTKPIKLTENQILALFVLLLLLNYGLIWTRGGYADDFVFLTYTQTKDLYSAISEWSFNNRYTQGLLLPVLLKISSAEFPGAFNWWILHGISLACLAVSMLLLNSILKVLQAPWLMRSIACLFFILYPIKNTTLMWPATIIGYVISLTLLLLGTYIYFSKAKANSETFFSLTSVWLLFLLAIFSIEQLFPLVILVIILRLYLWRIKFLKIISHIGIALSLLAIFVGINFVGKTEKISRYSLHDKSILENAIHVSVRSLIKVIESPLRLLLDPYYRNGILAASGQATFILSFIILIFLGWYYTTLNTKEYLAQKKAMLFLICGLIIWFAALSPLMVINYYMPDRVLFIPLIGLSITVGAIAFLFSQYQYFFRYTFFILLIVGGSAFSLVNIYTQNEFANKWQNEKILLEKLKNLNPTLKAKTTLSLFNFPSDYGLSPNLDDHFTFNGMVNWLYPTRNYQGETLGDFATIFSLPPDNSNKNYLDAFYPGNKNFTVLLWTGGQDNIIEIEGLFLSNNLKNNTIEIEPNNNTRNSITGYTMLLDTRVEGKAYTIKTPYLINFATYDLGLLNIILEYSTPPGRHRLNIHVEYNDKRIIPYDKTVAYASGSEELREGSLATSVFIDHISEVKSITIFSEKNNKNNKLIIQIANNSLSSNVENTAN